MKKELAKFDENIKLFFQNPQDQTKKELLSYISLLCKNKESLKVLQVQPIMITKCFICSKYVNPDQVKSYFSFNCLCYTASHIDCIKERALQVSKGFLNNEEEISKIKCDTCDKKLTARICCDYVFGKAEFNRHIDNAVNNIKGEFEQEDWEEYHKTKQKEFLCEMPTCNKPFKIENLRTSDCNHRFCVACIETYINNQCDIPNLKEIKCPLNTCNINLNRELIYAVGDFKKVANLEINFIGGEDYVKCPVCGNIFFTDEKSKVIKACTDHIV